MSLALPSFRSVESWRSKTKMLLALPVFSDAESWHEGCHAGTPPARHCA